MTTFNRHLNPLRKPKANKTIWKLLLCIISCHKLTLICWTTAAATATKCRRGSVNILLIIFHLSNCLTITASFRLSFCMLSECLSAINKTAPHGVAENEGKSENIFLKGHVKLSINIMRRIATSERFEGRNIIQYIKTIWNTCFAYY